MVKSEPRKEELSRTTVLVRGAGEMASGVAHRLFTSGLKVCLTEVSQPLAVRRWVCFSEAVYEGKKTVEGVTARLITNPTDILPIWEKGEIPLLVDPENRSRGVLKPHVLIDAIMAKENLGTRITDAPLVIGLGPGFCANRDVHVVIETNRGPNLGKLIYDGAAEPNTGVPGIVAGYGKERVIRSPRDGVLRVVHDIGTVVAQGEVVAWVDGEPVRVSIPGIIRGMLRDGTQVTQGLKLGDVESRGQLSYCTAISDKASALGEAALKAILRDLPQRLEQGEGGTSP